MARVNQVSERYEKKMQWARLFPDRIDPHTGNIYEDYIAEEKGRQAGRITLVTSPPLEGQ
jgi:hypothetical protein